MRTQTAEAPPVVSTTRRPDATVPAGADPAGRSLTTPAADVGSRTEMLRPASPPPPRADVVVPAPHPDDGRARGPRSDRPPTSGGRRWLRRTFQVVLTLLVLLVAYVGVTFAQVWAASTQDAPVKSDAIVVLGAAQYNGRPSPVLAARLDHAVLLFKQGVAPVVVVTGGGQPGDRFTESQASKQYLTDRGVPAAAILEENEASNSFDSLRRTAALLKSRGKEHVVLVSDPYHAFRIEAIADGLGLDANVSSTQTSPTRGLAKLKALGRETAAVAAGRIVGYDNLVKLENNY